MGQSQALSGVRGVLLMHLRWSYPRGYAGDWERRGRRVGGQGAGVACLAMGTAFLTPGAAYSFQEVTTESAPLCGGQGGLTLNQLPLALNDVLAEPPVLLVALDDQVLLAQQVRPAQAAGLQLRLLQLQLVRPAQQPQHLPLVLADGLPGQQVLQLRSLPPGTGQALLQPSLADRPRVQGGCRGLCSHAQPFLQSEVYELNSRKPQ